MKLTTKDCGRYTLVKVEEDITYANVREFFATLDEIIENDVLDVVLDLEDVPYITSRGLGAIVHSYTVLSKRGGTLIVVTDSEDVLSSFAVTKLDKILSLVPTLEAAEKELEEARKKEKEEETEQEN